jgi:uncharacterized protein (TIGR03083 family)
MSRCFATAVTLDYLTHIGEDSARFLDVLREAPADARVPTCPDWRADDLLWHLAEVQWFWGRVVREAVTDPEGMEPPTRPAGRAELVAFFDEATGLLGSALAATDPTERRWTWAEDQTAGFIRRRQAHEALIHRIDAELTAGVDRAAVDAALAADGVDEALRVMFGGAPPWANLELDHLATVRIRADDLGRTWSVTLGAFTGTSPSGREYSDAPMFEVSPRDEGEPAAATISAPAADLDCWLWGRPALGTLDRSGSDHVLDRFDAVIADGID